LYNVRALAQAGQSITFSQNKSTVNKQKVEIMILSSIENFQPELQPNSEQIVDGFHFSPACANAFVVCRHHLRL